MAAGKYRRKIFCRRWRPESIAEKYFVADGGHVCISGKYFAVDGGYVCISEKYLVLIYLLTEESHFFSIF